MQCPICIQKTEDLYTIERFSPPLHIVKCPSCGLQMQKQSGQEDHNKFYNKGYYTGEADYNYQDERNNQRGHEFVWRARLKNIARFIEPPASFLDVGCAFGGFVDAASRFGYRAFGLDVSSYAVEHAKSQKRDVRIGKLEGDVLPFPKRSFDVITLVEVMEHLADPCMVAKALSQIIRPKGLLVIQTANFLGWQARFAKQKYHYYLPGHLFYYSTKNLRWLLSRYGFGNFHFFRGVDFGLFAKLQKSQTQFRSIRDYIKWAKIAGYHALGRLAWKDFSFSSSMVMYAFQLGKH